MTPRREYRSGSVYQAHVKDCPRRGKCGCLWRATIEAGYTQSGARRRISVSGKTEAEAKRKLRDKRLQIERDGLPSAGGRVTVKKYADAWLESRRAEVRAGPWATDAAAVNKWINPTIGHKRLDDLTPADVKAVSTAQLKAGKSSSTRKRTHTTLTALLRAAMIDGHQVPARVLLVKAPESSVSDREAMTTEEVSAVMEVAVEHLPHWSRWLVQVLYGLRPAEVLGLTRDALDFDNGLIVVQWQLKALPYIDRKDKRRGYVIPDGVRTRHLVDAWHLTAPKTKKGERVLPMLPIVRAALTDWLERAPGSPYGLVWPTLTGRPANEKHDLAEWYALQGSAGVGHPTAGRPYYIYEARHALATRLMELGVDEHVITALMGHSSIVTSRGYMHANQRHALEAMEQVAEMLALTPGGTASTP